MHSRKKAMLTATVSASLLVVAALAGCSSTPSSTPNSGAAGGKTTFNLAGVAAYTQDPFWASLQCGATKQAEAMGSKITWYSSASDTSSATQQANYNAALLTKPDALLLASWQVGTFSTQVKDLMAKGTPVIGVNSTITPATERVLFVNGEDNSEFVKYIANEMKGQSGTIGVLGGVAGDAGAIARWKPVIDQLKAVAPNLKPLPTQYDDFDRTKSSTVASALIVAHPDLKALYAISGPEGEGAANAVAQAGKSGQIKVYSYGANEAEVAGLKSGVFSALEGQPAYGLGVEGVKAAISYLKTAKPGAPVPQLNPVTVNVPLKVLTKANVDDPANVTFLQKSTCN
ncbi:MAG: ribose transport system substrate-binding protein [Actinomycetota bacterium]|jgi:ribose transport system substrate-binding protein|nr:hypothetical protein [Glaciihabitans sp.]MDQ1555889.1 ribose transport system substrate-binding protein [Actinomycetota bacterium]